MQISRIQFEKFRGNLHQELQSEKNYWIVREKKKQRK